MTTRARELLNRSRALLGGSREAAAQLLAPPPTRSTPARSGRTQAPAGSRVPGARAAATPSPAEEALSAICADLALRDLNLVDTLLAQLEEMESREEDADRLAELYRLDHLAARLRRNAENLRVLAGRDAGEQGSQTSSLIDVIRGAMSSIDHYQRVTVGRVVNLGVVGFAAEDVSRLLAELLDNATKSSPPHSPVRVGAHLTETGSALLRIEDEGIGLPADRLRQINQRLTADPVLDDDAVRHMGLAVVRRLATRHGIKVWLDHRHPHGTTGSVLLPAPLVCELPDAGWSGLQTVSVPAGTDSPGRSGDVEDVQATTPLNGHAGSRPTAVSTRNAGRPAARRAEPAPASPPPPAAASAGTTASGLPRRVSHSLRDTYGDAIGARAGAGSPEGAAEAADPTVGHRKLLADLGAFSEGERAARDERAD
ncbi:ATP-binding protein [Pseudofrankia sp. DC12]|uniref:sensor histidine kinase n=1 Tax=Pseudofrankia sp. DC12 TaxID=683315 RepID=UPI0005F7D507|nr:ATP-binding protein [Pseudofrankia sp. DC12]